MRILIIKYTCNVLFLKTFRNGIGYLRWLRVDILYPSAPIHINIKMKPKHAVFEETYHIQVMHELTIVCDDPTHSGLPFVTHWSYDNPCCQASNWAWVIWRRRSSRRMASGRRWRMFKQHMIWAVIRIAFTLTVQGFWWTVNLNAWNSFTYTNQGCN